MPYTVIEHLLVTERVHQRAARSGGFSVPAMNERSADPSHAPFLVTNMRGGFIPTRASMTQCVRYGFSEVPAGTDNTLLASLHKTLYDLSSGKGWSNRATTVQGAVTMLQSFGYKPSAVVVGRHAMTEILPNVTVEQAQEQMWGQGHLAEVDGMKVYFSDLPDKAALIATIPALLGVYTRIGDYLGLCLQRVDRHLVVVG